MDEEQGQLPVGGLPIAWRRRQGQGPAVVWLCGYRSDMGGTKVAALDAAAAARGRAFVRFDYSGHGRSGGTFEDGTIGRWAGEAGAVTTALAGERPVLVGSSMGAWIALLVARALNAAGVGLSGLVLIAPAADFTVDLVEARMNPAQRAALAAEGRFVEQYDATLEPNIYTRALIEDGRRHRVLDRPIDTRCPVHIIQGRDDVVVPVAHALRLAALLPADDLMVTLVPGGDHRLSRPDDIALIIDAVAAMAFWGGA